MTEQPASTLFIEVTHANLHTKVVVFLPQLFTWYYSAAHKSTMLVATGGGIIPCTESPDEVKSKVQLSRLQQ